MQNLYIVFKGGAGIGNVNWIKFNAVAGRPLRQDVQGNKMFSASIYPNPTTGYFKIKMNNPLTEPVTIIINDKTGRTVSRNSVRGNYFDFFKTQQLLRGVYSVQILKGKERLTKRLIIH